MGNRLGIILSKSHENEDSVESASKVKELIALRLFRISFFEQVGQVS